MEVQTHCVHCDGGGSGGVSCVPRDGAWEEAPETGGTTECGGEHTRRLP